MRIEEAYARLDENARLAALRGSLIFHLDLATEVARAVFARRGIATERLATMTDDDGYRVFAFDDGPAARAVAEARFDDAGDAIVLVAPAAPPPRAATLAEARRTIAADVEAGAVIVVPSSDPRRPIEGYALAIAASADMMCVADHWLLTLDPAGRRVDSRHRLAAATDPAPIDLRPRRDVGLMHDGATSNELHTYLSLKHGVILSVETSESRIRWRVDGERVSRG